MHAKFGPRLSNHSRLSIKPRIHGQLHELSRWKSQSLMHKENTVNLLGGKIPSKLVLSQGTNWRQTKARNQTNSTAAGSSQSNNQQNLDPTSPGIGALNRSMGAGGQVGRKNHRSWSRPHCRRPPRMRRVARRMPEGSGGRGGVCRCHVGD